MKLFWYGTVEYTRNNGDINTIIGGKLFILKQDHNKFQNIKDLLKINKIVFIEYLYNNNSIIDVSEVSELKCEIKEFYIDENHNIIIIIVDNNKLILSHNNPIFETISNKLKIGVEFKFHLASIDQKLHLIFIDT